jgi:hypothetical protein
MSVLARNITAAIEAEVIINSIASAVPKICERGNDDFFNRGYSKPIWDTVAIKSTKL